jgi:hypothetical protein
MRVLLETIKGVVSDVRRELEPRTRRRHQSALPRRPAQLREARLDVTNWLKL